MARDWRSSRDPAKGADLQTLANQTERAIRLLLVIGLAVLAAVSLSGLLTGGGVRFVIWAFVGALSAITVGGAVGLLFGLPTAQSRSIQLAAARERAATPTTPVPAAPAAPPATPPATAAATPSPTAPSIETAASSSEAEAQELDTGYRDSTSLEQIADWLTKIIVGLTLTQFASWEARFDTFARNLTEAMMGPSGRSEDCLTAIATLSGQARVTALSSALCEIPPASAIPGGVLVALFATAGFLISYLWMRRYFILEMVIARKAAVELLAIRNAETRTNVAAQTVQQTQSEAQAAKAAEEKLKADLDRVQAEFALQVERTRAEAALQVERVKAEAAAQQEELAKEKARLEEALQVAGERGLAPKERKSKGTLEAWATKMLQKGKELLPPASGGGKVLAAIEQALPEKNIYPLDPWRGLFGEQSTVDDLSLVAEVSPTSNPSTFEVKLAVRAPEALIGTQVVYYLHPTFGDKPVGATFDVNGQAPLEFFAYGAFTVGVVTENGTTLELNLATLSEAPITFRSR